MNSLWWSDETHNMQRKWTRVLICITNVIP